MRGSFVLLSILIWSTGLYARAEESAAPPGTDYQGVSPLMTNEPPFPEKVGSSRVLTWPGFERNADGCFRVFFQISEPATWSSEKTDTGIDITFKNTRTHLRNTTRPLDMSHFDAPVNMLHVVRKGKDVIGHIMLRDVDNVPRLRTVTQEETGYYFLLAEFKCVDGMAAPDVSKKSNK